MEIEKSKVYVHPDAEGRITRIDGGYTLSNIKDYTDWVLIDEGYGDRYNLCQGNYLPGPLYDDRGVCRYKLVGGEVQERTQEEMDADYATRPAPEQTTEELLLETAADHEYRLCLMELGVSEDDL